MRNGKRATETGRRREADRPRARRAQRPPTGKPGESLLIKAIRQVDELKMPPKGRLPDDVVADLEKWIAMGAPDPRDGTVTSSKRVIDIDPKSKKFNQFIKSIDVGAAAGGLRGLGFSVDGKELFVAAQGKSNADNGQIIVIDFPWAASCNRCHQAFRVPAEITAFDGGGKAVQ